VGASRVRNRPVREHSESACRTAPLQTHASVPAGPASGDPSVPPRPLLRSPLSAAHKGKVSTPRLDPVARADREFCGRAPGDPQIGGAHTAAGASVRLLVRGGQTVAPASRPARQPSAGSHSGPATPPAAVDPGCSGTNGSSSRSCSRSLPTATPVGRAAGRLLARFGACRCLSWGRHQGARRPSRPGRTLETAGLTVA
jgi:hypothetical protein